MVQVEFRLPVLSEVSSRTGTWELRRQVELAAVPAQGDTVMCDDDVTHAEVKRLTWVTPGPGRPPGFPEVIVHLRPERRGGRWIDEFGSLDALVSDWGWEQVGGPYPAPSGGDHG